MIDALHIDPDSIVVTDKPIGSDGVVVTATASHRATAQLKADYHLGGRFDQTLPAGMVMYSVDYDGSDPDVADILWCGGHVKVKTAERPLCVWRSESGYNFSVVDEGVDWLVSPNYLDSYRLTQKGDDFSLSPSDADLVGPVKLLIKLGWVTPDHVDLTLTVVRDGQEGEVWYGTRKLKLNANKQAEIPFWNSRLHLTLDGEVVRASMTRDGDGKSGWNVDANAETLSPPPPIGGDPVSNKPPTPKTPTESGMSPAGLAFGS